MDKSSHDLIKHREISFCPLHADPAQAQSALLLFSDVKGIINLGLINEHRIQISYDIRHLTLKDIEEVLIEIGFHLDNSLMFKLKRALYYYTEEVQRENLGCHGKNCTRNVFINRYNKLQHGCRDERPAHWRKYL
jgi:hypothetical protein